MTRVAAWQKARSERPARVEAERKTRSERLSRARAALDRFPAFASYDREELFKSIALANSLTDKTFRLITKLPHAAKCVARFIPIVGNVDGVAALPKDGPIILAGRHFGSTFFVSTVIARMFRRRNLYVLHGYAEESAASRYVRASGNIPVARSVSGGSVLKHLSDILSQDPKCVLWLAFDSMGSHGRRGRRMDVNFLGTTVSVPMGLAYLARTHGVPVVSLGWEFSFRGPRVRLGNLHEADHGMEPNDCEEQLTRRLFAELEEQILKAPQEWTEWFDCFPIDA